MRLTGRRNERLLSWKSDCFVKTLEHGVFDRVKVNAIRLGDNPISRLKVDLLFVQRHDVSPPVFFRHSPW